jgi:glycine cleavage system aminomethyltransferase T
VTLPSTGTRGLRWPLACAATTTALVLAACGSDDGGSGDGGSANDQGVVTSVAFSPSLNHWIGLGLLVRGRVSKEIITIEEEDDKGKKTIERETLKTEVTALDLDTAELIEIA